MTSGSERTYPMNAPAGHRPPITRYTARYANSTAQLVALFVGVQTRQNDALVASDFSRWLDDAVAAEGGPAHFDRATYVDPEGYTNQMAALYWRDRGLFAAWRHDPIVSAWRERPMKDGTFGMWWEPVVTATDRSETIAFKEYVRGLSACPFSHLEQTNESGYWGAARDRIPASAHDRLMPVQQELTPKSEPGETFGRRIRIKPPLGMTIIRSGVSWQACGDEQLESYEQNVRPKLDAGMEHLRQNPIETGCACLRRVTATDHVGAMLKEEYSHGLFISLGHLERWAMEHPTHLAIYTRAMAERRKYQDRLELRTYNEIYVLDGDSDDFEYTNCHGRTGLLPFFSECR